MDISATLDNVTFLITLATLIVVEVGFLYWLTRILVKRGIIEDPRNISLYDAEYDFWCGHEKNQNSTEKSTQQKTTH